MRLPQSVANINYFLYQIISNASKIIDPGINGSSPNDVSSNLHICDPSIVKFLIREKCIGLSNTSHVDSLDIFRR